MKLDLPARPAMVTWEVEASYLVAIPQDYQSITLASLRDQLQATADRKRSKPPLGPLEFRYETDKDNYVTVVHAYFTNKHGKKTRFMRLRREGT